MHVALAIGIVVWTVLLWIGFWALWFLRWLASLFPAGRPSGPGGPIGGMHRPPPVRVPALQQTILLSPFDLTIVCLVLVFGLLAIILGYLLVRRRATLDAPGPDEERSSVWSWGLFLSQLRDLWMALRGFWRTAAGAVAVSSPAGSTEPAAGQQDDIRSLYRRFLRFAAVMRHPRAPAVTPTEFARLFGRVLPWRSAEVDTITAAYDRARYGLQPVSAERMTAAREALNRLEETNSGHH
jgi:hypothetical protein